jgi:hypothetical protein
VLGIADRPAHNRLRKGGTMRRLLLMSVFLLLTPAAIAQPAPDAPPPPPPGDAAAPPPAGHRAPLRERFEAANTTHDGKLTLDQARAAHLVGVVRHFSEIDADHKGYVTLQDVHTWMAAQRAARGGGQMPPPGEGPPPGAPPPPQ